MKITKKKFKVLSDEKIIKGAYTQYSHLTYKFINLIKRQLCNLHALQFLHINIEFLIVNIRNIINFKRTLDFYALLYRL